MNKFRCSSFIIFFFLVSVFQGASAGYEKCSKANKNTDLVSLAEQDVEDFFELSPAELANISVTIASGSERPVAIAAGATTLITAEQIEAMGATDLDQVLETIPGLHVGINPLSNDPVYSIRGIRNATGSQVLLLLDGTRLSTPYFGSRTIGFRMPTQNIQRIEVIRGPGSAVYGADAFAGVINIISKQACDIDGTTIGGRVGNFDSQSAWAQHGGNWIGWDVAASLQYQHSNGDHNRIVESDAQTQIDTQLGSQASLAPGAMDTRFELWNAQLGLQRKHWNLRFWASNQNDMGVRAGVAAALDPGGSFAYQNYLGDIRFSSEDYFNDLEIQAHLSYLYANTDSFLHLFPSNAQLPIGQDGNVDFVNPVGLTSFSEGYIGTPGRTQHIPSITLTGIYTQFAQHNIRISTGYRYEGIETNEGKNFGPGVIDGSQSIVNGDLTDVTDTSFVYLENTHRSIWSVSLQDEWSFADDWLLTTGLRYDYYSDFGSTVNPRIALVWSTTDTLTTKLLYGRAFRAPSFAEQGLINNPVFLGNPSLDPETINTVELAFDFTPLSTINTKFNIYYYQISDLLQPLPDPNATTLTVQNARDQEGYGLELEWDWQIIDQLGINGNYSWQHSEDQATKHRIAGVPAHQLFVAADWSISPQWLFHAQLNWVGKRYRMPNDKRGDIDDYETVDLTLRGKKLFDYVNLVASVKNVFDAAGYEIGPPGLKNDYPLQGRSYYVEASVDF